MNHLLKDKTSSVTVLLEATRVLPSHEDFTLDQNYYQYGSSGSGSTSCTSSWGSEIAIQLHCMTWLRIRNAQLGQQTIHCPFKGI